MYNHLISTVAFKNYLLEMPWSNQEQDSIDQGGEVFLWVIDKPVQGEQAK